MTTERIKPGLPLKDYVPDKQAVAVLDPPKVSEHALALGIPTNDVQAIIRANMRNLNRMFELYALKDRKQLSQEQMRELDELSETYSDSNPTELTGALKPAGVQLPKIQVRDNLIRDKSKEDID